MRISAEKRIHRLARAYEASEAGMCLGHNSCSAGFQPVHNLARREPVQAFWPIPVAIGLVDAGWVRARESLFPQLDGSPPLASLS